ncbi:MAG: S-methyl-5-thioribose-1-phosphate isomerase [Verrucomicrobiae bacterium]|nr:S-methyl-5-thioribose-1-phosphate isomerase [Verrucomicrobiae bacterium]
MHVNGTHYRTVWLGTEPGTVRIIDQRKLPFAFEIEDLRSVDEVATAIRDMHVRGAGCIGATAGYGMYLAALEASAGGDFDEIVNRRAVQLIATRPTAVNLRWAVDRQLAAMSGTSWAGEKLDIAESTARAIADEDAEACRAIGEHGLEIIRNLHAAKAEGEPVNILTHCNAGWLAFVDHGSATSPIYAAHAAGIPVHVWVDETRPRNQGARLTAWELGQEGVPHTVIADNVGGHLMQHGRVDLVITGTDRTTWTGDVANKIGTYLKALAARDNQVPFYVALPSSTFDWEIENGVRQIPIEERGGEEVSHLSGFHDESGEEREVRLTPDGSVTANFAFDVTPARLVTGLITERGICEASGNSVRRMYPERFE